jgi:hypothetical protein
VQRAVSRTCTPRWRPHSADIRRQLNDSAARGNGPGVAAATTRLAGTPGRARAGRWPGAGRARAGRGPGYSGESEDLKPEAMGECDRASRVTSKRSVASPGIRPEYPARPYPSSGGITSLPPPPPPPPPPPCSLFQCGARAAKKLGSLPTPDARAAFHWDAIIHAHSRWGGIGGGTAGRTRRACPCSARPCTRPCSARPCTRPCTARPSTRAPRLPVSRPLLSSPHCERLQRAVWPCHLRRPPTRMPCRPRSSPFITCSEKT